MPPAELPDSNELGYIIIIGQIDDGFEALAGGDPALERERHSPLDRKHHHARLACISVARAPKMSRVRAKIDSKMGLELGRIQNRSYKSARISHHGLATAVHSREAGFIYATVVVVTSKNLARTGRS